MDKFQAFLEKNYKYITIVLLSLIFFRTCNSDSKNTIKRIKELSQKVDSLSMNSVNRSDLQIEGLKSEKRMIQSTDRKMMDLQRQAEIDREIKRLEEK